MYYAADKTAAISNPKILFGMFSSKNSNIAFSQEGRQLVDPIAPYTSHHWSDGTNPRHVAYSPNDA